MGCVKHKIISSALWNNLTYTLMNHKVHTTQVKYLPAAQIKISWMEMIQEDKGCPRNVPHVIGTLGTIFTTRFLHDEG